MNRPPTSSVIQAKGERSVAKLEKYHELGREVNALLEADSKSKSIAEVASEKEVHVSTLMKARAFARRYTKRELGELCRLRNRRTGLPLNWGYVPYLLIIRDKENRSELQKEAAREGWTAPELYAVIKKRYPELRRKRNGSEGGRPRKPKELHFLVPQLKGLLADLQACLDRKSSSRQFRNVKEAASKLQGLLGAFSFQ